MTISSKEQLNHVLSIELCGVEVKNLKRKIQLFFNSNRFSLIWLLRYTEYYSTKKDFLGKLLFRVFSKRYSRVQLLTGITLPLGVCDEGLTIYHIGSIVINGRTRIGRNCCLMNNVNIGSNNGETESPKIGDNVYIGPGAVIFGDIEIADNSYIGANAVVNKSVKEKGSVILGIPATTVRISKQVWWQKNKMKREL